MKSQISKKGRKRGAGAYTAKVVLSPPPTVTCSGSPEGANTLWGFGSWPHGPGPTGARRTGLLGAGQQSPVHRKTNTAPLHDCKPYSERYS